jgi:acetyl esterase
MTEPKTPVLESAAREFAQATSKPPFIYELPVAEGRQTLENLQPGDELKPAAKSEDMIIEGGPTGHVTIRIVTPPDPQEPLPVVLYIHGAGWVFGSPDTHDRLVRELAVALNAALVVPAYDRSPEAKYPTAIEQCWATAKWIVTSGSQHGLDPTRLS